MATSSPSSRPASDRQAETAHGRHSCRGALPSPAAAQAVVAVVGDVPNPVTLSDSAQAMPPTQVALADQGQPPASYEGVLLKDLLARAVVVEASDGCRVVFAIAELDASIGGSVILLADRKGGQPRDSREGPFRLVAAADKRPARSVRHCTVIHVLEIPAAH